MEVKWWDIKQKHIVRSNKEKREGDSDRKRQSPEWEKEERESKKRWNN